MAILTKNEIVTLVLQMVPPADQALMLGLIEHESSFKPYAFQMDSNGGSIGLTQMDVPTARDRGFSGSWFTLFDEPMSIIYGYAQIGWLRAFKGGTFTPDQVIAGYNEGAGNVLKGIKDQPYVAAVSAARDRWQAILDQRPKTA